MSILNKALAGGLLLSASSATIAMSGAPASVDTDNSELSNYHTTWEYKTLTRQSLLDNAVPYSQGFRLQAHNAFNSSAYSSIVYLDPNHGLSITEQLEAGVRQLELDAHWIWQTKDIPNGKALLLCHAQSSHFGCSGLERYVRDATEEIRNWLNKNPQEVIAIYVQDEAEGEYDELVDAFEPLHDLIYKAAPRNEVRSTYEVVKTLSEEDILAAGKQVLVMSGAKGAFTYYSHDGSYNGMGAVDDFAALDESECIDDMSRQQTHHRLFDDGTNIGAIFVGEGTITPALAAKAVRCGASALGADHLTIGDDRAAATIWSWAQGYPQAAQVNHDCAYHGADGRFRDSNCADDGKYACKTMDGRQWAVSGMGTENTYAAGQAACQALGSQWHFGVPTNAQQNEALKRAKAAVGTGAIWLDYRDTVSEGTWVTSAHQLSYDGGVADLKAVKQGETYKFFMKATAVDCEFQWEGGSATERDAKFDCQSTPDPMMFTAIADPQIEANGNVSIAGYIKTQIGDQLCGLEWDGSLQSDNERNAKFDCDGNADPLVITSLENGTSDRVIITSNGCGLQWEGGSADDDGERTAKWDCGPAHDELKIYGVVAPSDYRELRVASSNQCLDFEGVDPANGAKAIVHDCAGVAWQKWKYEPNTGLLRSKQNPDYCLDHASTFSDGARPHMWQCASWSDNQKWDRIGDTFRPRFNHNFVLDAFGSSNGDAAGLWSVHNGTNQQWTFGND
ncbi:ricin-type beta-trefoil lectin domain protein [Bacterioplanoides sp. SCSIO 12839]|uniref:ricin-type beta-trefoil lectin domain protein n=1 Tax=Bacterioplanoides sp. SCSIO 12839 TaxID=2829569 RepID=UPI002104194F|nr:ricin-type beta-trefoil lectin domain protein [Bacterioplanoides sp. SCSIO 12839]UTW49938.1 ricin-type beta-trefoil lectin domain protein [Bacterioplanoides sp. SCSIO 12839]